MKSNKYWENRANKRMASYHKNSDETISKINGAYDKAIKDINEDINKIFYKYQLGSDLSVGEAKDLLNSKIPKKELDSIRSRIYDIKDKELKNYMMAQLNSGAYSARITRLEALKESIYINSKIVADVEVRESNLGYINNINKAYYSNIYDIQKGTGLAFEFATMPVDTIEEILKNEWSGKHFSDRVWKNTDVLAEKLEGVITSGLMSGKSSRRMALELADLTEYGKFAAERLVRTETTYVTNQAELESYKECGICKYVFVATLDLRTSNVCREHDGKVYEVSKGIAGENLPALHAFCRSTTIAYFGEETLNNLRRRARDPQTGQPYVLDKNMNYKDWYQEYAVNKYGPQKAETFERMIKNKSSDKKQHKLYKEVLGKEAPKSLKEFKDLKYNNNEKYKTLKADYRKINYYNKVIANEPAITSDLKQVSNSTGVELVGLDFRLKSKESYLRKVNTDSDNSLDLQVVKDTIENTNDIIRYTYQVPHEELVDRYFEVNKCLHEKGYEQIKLKNTWTIKSNPYKGVNCNYVSLNGQKFEIQYHTPESFELKNGELHNLYEGWRIIKDKSSKEAIRISEKMSELSNKLIYPINIDKVR